MLKVLHGTIAAYRTCIFKSVERVKNILTHTTFTFLCILEIQKNHYHILAKCLELWLYLICIGRLL